MNKKNLGFRISIVLIPIFILLHSTGLFCQENTRWTISEHQTIMLRFDDANAMPYQDNIEMSGKKVSAIIYYQIDENQNLSLQKELFYPQLRTYNQPNEPDWKKYRAYFKRDIEMDKSPEIFLDGKMLLPSKIDSIEIGGFLRFYYQEHNGLRFVRTLFPSMDERLFIDQWDLINAAQKTIDLTSEIYLKVQIEEGYKGDYTFSISNYPDDEISIPSGKKVQLPIFYSAQLNEEEEHLELKDAWNSRKSFLDTIQQRLVLKTPNQVLNTLFYFSKIRAAESIFNSSMGLVHSPGGGNYYCGIWANDQVEYSGPFFPYLDYQIGRQAAYNTYAHFLKNIPAGDGHIAYAFEVDGHFPMTHLDRGDAAMIAYGSSLYALNTGVEKARELWPLIEWSLAYCHKKKNAFGAVESQSDEMEGRIETGTANLSTSSLYYGGLKFASRLAKALGYHDKSEQYSQQQLQMEEVIESYFGATMEGLETYKYFRENEYLRHWICLPLTMGIETRSEGTLDALFDKLWTKNGVEVQYDPNKEGQRFWDRATLYALKGAFKAGAKERALVKLLEYSENRLLGDHVPYPVEAYPENNMKHLSAESALYARIFIEGLLGIEPLSFNQVKLSPSIPEEWPTVILENVSLSGNLVDIRLKRISSGLHLKIEAEDKVFFDDRIDSQVVISF